MQLRPLHIDDSPPVEQMPRRHFTWAAFVHYSHLGFIVFCLSVALSIAFCQTVIVPILVYWMVTVFKERGLSAGHSLLVSEQMVAAGRAYWIKRLSVPLFTWLCITGISSLFGINALHSCAELLKTSLYLLIPFCVFSSLFALPATDEERMKRIQMYLLALIAGQSLAGIHSVLSAAIGYELEPRIPGPVTESGQLVLVLPMLVGLLFSYMQRLPVESAQAYAATRRDSVLLTAATFLSFLLLAWPALLYPAIGSHLATLVQPAAALCLILALSVLVGKGRQKNRSANASSKLHAFVDITPYTYFCYGAGALLFATLLINLKRGPWLGVFIELLVLGAFFSRKLIFGTILGSSFFLLSLAPARDRIGSLVEHFTIAGGRLSMWRLGAELVSRYPLGVGLKNASYMRTLDPTLPYLHRHMHNNLLNVAVESGWIGAAAFVWWMVVATSIGIYCWRRFHPNAETLRQARILLLCAGIAILGWQVSGLVEYNFGDGEVRLIAFFLMGIILSLASFFPVSRQ